MCVPLLQGIEAVALKCDHGPLIVSYCNKILKKGEAWFFEDGNDHLRTATIGQFTMHEVVVAQDVDLSPTNQYSVCSTMNIVFLS